MPLPRTALGRFFENRIIETLVVLSDGAIVCYRPETDFEGTDAHFSLRHKPGEIRIQIKGRAYHDPDGNIKVEVKAEDIPEGDPKYILAGEYFPKRAALGEVVWLVHSDEFKRLGRLSGGMWRGALSPSPSSKDRWVPYRYRRFDLPRIVIELIRRQGRGEALPRSPADVRALLREGARRQARARDARKKRKAVARAVRPLRNKRQRQRPPGRQGARGRRLPVRGERERASRDSNP